MIRRSLFAISAVVSLFLFMATDAARKSAQQSIDVRYPPSGPFGWTFENDSISVLRREGLPRPIRGYVDDTGGDTFPPWLHAREHEWHSLGFDVTRTMEGVGVGHTQPAVVDCIGFIIVVAIPYWFVFTVTAVLPVAYVARMTWVGRRAREGFCSSCGYDLRGTPDRCPECGAIPAPSRYTTHLAEQKIRLHCSVEILISLPAESGELENVLLMR